MEKSRKKIKYVKLKKIIPVSFAVIALLLLLPLLPTFEEFAHGKFPEEVKIGCPLPLSGMVATMGEQMRFGMEIAAEEVNAAGGIKALGGAKLKLIYGDTKSTPDVCASETERLIVKERVPVIVGNYGSAPIFVGTEVAQRYKTPCLGGIGVKDEITERGFDYVFRDFIKASWSVKEIIQAIELFHQETGKKPETVAHLYEGTGWGQSTAEYFAKLMPQAGYKIVMNDAYPPGTTDFTSHIIKLKGLKPDLFLVCMYTPEHIIFNKQQYMQKLYLPYGFWSMGGGAEDPNFYKSVPPEVNALMFLEEDWDAMASKRPWYPEVNKKFKAKFSFDLTSPGVSGYGWIYLVKDVLERASYDPDLAKYRKNIRDALAVTKIDPKNCGTIEKKIDGKTICPALARGIVGIEFDREGQNPHAWGSISQNQKGNRIPLWPKAIRDEGAKVIWPVPPWDKRGPWMAK